MGQAWHETGGYTSELSRDYLNIFGITNHVTGYGEKTTSGFMRYKSYEDCIENYFSILVNYINKSQLEPPTTFIGFGAWLKQNGYYTDTLDNYTNGMVNGWVRTSQLLNI